MKNYEFCLVIYLFSSTFTYNINKIKKQTPINQIKNICFKEENNWACNYIVFACKSCKLYIYV